MKSPFKFLDSYTKDDREIFFGRDREIEELYHRVFESKLMLVYGVSGTGKSSLIHCGLANKFQETDWLPLIVRRGGNIIKSLAAAVKAASITHQKSQRVTPLHFKKAVKSLYLDHYKPVFFIFDQFEELFIFGDKSERRTFINIIKTLVESDLQCRLIFIMREEYMAGVTEFERHIPTFFANRVRIEKISQVNALEAIKGPCKVASISLEEGFAETLLERLSPESADLELTYLQVFLDKIFRLASDSFPPIGGESKEGSFTLELLQKVGNVSDLLGSFLDEQITLLNDPDSALAVLKSFVSAKGTKKQMTSDEAREYAQTLGKPVEDSLLIEMLQNFVNLRILQDKDQNGHYELRHDALASKIFEKITLVEKEILEIRQFIENAWNNWQKRKVLISSADLEYIAPYKNRLYLPVELSSLIEKSRYELIRKKRKRRNVAISASIILFFIFAGFTVWALSERNKAFAQSQKSKVLLLIAKARETNLSNPTKAIRYAQLAYNKDNTNPLVNQILSDVFHTTDSKPFYIVSFRHRERVTSADFSPDGKSILTASLDNTGKLWNMSGKCLVTLSGHSSFVISAVFSPDGKSILTASSDKTAKLWDLSGKCLVTLCGHLSDVVSAIFSQDGKTILTASVDKTARLWDLSGKCLVTLSGHSDRVFSAIFSPDGKSILTNSYDKTAKLWDVTGKCLVTFSGHLSSINSAFFSSDGKSILTASNDKTAKLWDLSGKCLATLSGHSDIVIHALYSSDGKFILTASHDKTARLWDLSGKSLVTFSGHSSSVYSALFSPDGKSILTASADKTAKLWDLSGKCLVTLSGHSDIVNSAVFSPDGLDILTFSSDKTANLWDLSEKGPVIFSGHSSYVRSAVFSPDSKSVLTASIDKTAKLWDLSGKCLVTFSGHTNVIYSAVFSPDGKSILTASGDSTAKMWDLSGKCLSTFIGHTFFVYSAVFSPDGKSILTASLDKTAKLWDLSGKCLFTLPLTSFVTSAVFSPDGKTILTASLDKTAKLWDLSGKCLVTFSGHTKEVYSAIFSPDGKSILTASVDKTSKLWDLSGKCLVTLSGHSGYVRSAVFSPKGKFLLTASDDRTSKLWDLSGNCLVTFSGHLSSVFSANFSSDGNSILTASFNVAKLWLTPSFISQWLTTGKIGTLSPEDKSEIDESDNFRLIYQSENLSFLTDYADWYLNRGDTANAISLYKRTMQLNPKAIDKKMLGGIYRKQNYINEYLALYRDNPEEVIKEEISALVDTSSINNYSAKLNFFSEKAKLYEKLLTAESSLENKFNAASNYNNVGWHGLLSGKYNEALLAIQRGIELCPSDEYLYSNLPLCFLFTNQYEKAVEVYKEWKDKSVTTDPRFKKFKEAFLADLDDFEKKGITHPDFKNVRELLKK